MQIAISVPIFFPQDVLESHLKDLVYTPAEGARVTTRIAANLLNRLKVGLSKLKQ